MWCDFMCETCKCNKCVYDCSTCNKIDCFEEVWTTDIEEGASEREYDD